MNFSSVIPQPNVMVSRPVKVSATGNMYKIPLVHTEANGESRNYEVWATKEAIQQHFVGQTDSPKEYQMRKFARQTYEKQLRNANGVLQHQGILVTTDHVSHGNPKLWPSTLSHPEIKY